MAEGATPNLARMRERGASAAGSVSDYPDCTTPPGHAVLWTGHPASRNGVTSFKVPCQPPSEHTVLEASTGFDARLLLSEPIWVTALRAGRTATLVHTPLSAPLEPWTPEGRFGLDAGDRLVILHGYGEHRLQAWAARDPELLPARGWRRAPFETEGALEFAARTKPPRLSGLLVRDPATGDPMAWVVRDRSHADRGVAVRAGPDAPWSELLEVEPGVFTRLRLFEADPGTGKLLLFGSDVFGLDTRPASLADDYVKELGCFPGGGAYRLYSDGSFGPTLADGRAELRYLETQGHGMDHFRAASRYAVERHPADLMIFYHPGIDELGHLWASFVERGEPHHDPEKEALVWPRFLDSYRKADEHLGDLLDRLPPEGTLVLVSDHGVSGIRRHFLPNVVLREAGLLRCRPGNPYQIDPQRTRAIYHPANNGYLFVNDRRFRRGNVPERERQAVIDEARALLTGFKDPETGKPVLAAAIDVGTQPEDSELRGQGRGDLFLVAARGYSLGDPLHHQALLPADLCGHHQQAPGLRAHHAILEATGPGIEPGTAIGVVSHRDVHETFRLVLGLEPGDGGGTAIEALFTPR